jgi:predicted PurR-regulated permease PerM
MQPAGRDFARRAAMAVGIALLLVLLALAAVRVARLLLLVFASILMAVVLRGLSDWLAERSRLSPGLAYALTLLGLLALVVAGGWLLVPSVVEQFEELQARLPDLMEQFQRRLSRYGPGRELLNQLGRLEGAQQEVFEQAAGVATVSLGGLAYLLFFGFSGIYIGANPGLYVEGRCPGASARARCWARWGMRCGGSCSAGWCRCSPWDC